MKNEEKLISLINNLILKHRNIAVECLPITKEKLEENSSLCNILIDFLGDIYIAFGFDENYCETKYGEILSESIDFLASLNKYEL